MNKLFLIGRLSKDIELRYTQSNKAVASTTIAVNRQKKEDGADFINLVVWGKSAENLYNYQKKGNQIAVDGRIQTRNYEDSDGNKRYVTEVVAENIKFLDSKKQENAQNSQNIVQKSNSEILKDAMTDNNPYAEFGEQMTITDEDLPF